jgi:hypothetical protein
MNRNGDFSTKMPFLERMLQMLGRSFSYELQRRLVKEPVCGPLGEARDSIEEFSGQKVGKGSLETIIN